MGIVRSIFLFFFPGGVGRTASLGNSEIGTERCGRKVGRVVGIASGHLWK